LIFSDRSLILTDCLTIYVAKSVFAGKNCFATLFFSMKKTFFSPTGKYLPTLVLGNG